MVALQNGYIYEMAAVYAGVSVSSIYKWLARGRAEFERREGGQSPNRGESRYLQFLHEVEEAKAIAGSQWQDVVNRAATADPNWAWRMLQIRFPDQYSPPARHEVTGAEGGPVQVAHSLNLAEMDDDGLRDSLAALGRVAAQLAADGREANDHDGGGASSGDTAA